MKREMELLMLFAWITKSETYIKKEKIDDQNPVAARDVVKALRDRNIIRKPIARKWAFG